jgi:hypothetical protein
MNTKTITINNLTAVNETAWYKDASSRLAILPVKIRWQLKKNMNALNKLANEFEEFKISLEEELRNKYVSDEYSYDAENGERKVKEEYLEEYRAAVTDINQKLYEVLSEEEEITLNVIDMDALMEALPDDAPLNDSDFDMLSLFDIETTIEKVDGEIVE